MEYIPQMYKALVPVAVGLLVTGLGYAGISGQMTVEEALTFIVTAALVWLVPNKK